jgi:phage host-nuclease inhibitor protein Gam
VAKATKHPIPKDETEAARLLNELEQLKLALDTSQTVLNQAVNNLVDIANREAEPMAEAFADRFTALKTYANKHKDELTDEGKRRSISWVTGTLGWRTTPAGISVPRNAQDIARLIARILAIRKAKFLRRKWELNVEAMEANPEEATAIEGINRRAASESFFIRFNDGTEVKQKIKLKAPSDKDLKNL